MSCTSIYISITRPATLLLFTLQWWILICPHLSRYLDCLWIISIGLGVSVTLVCAIWYMGEHIWCSQHRTAGPQCHNTCISIILMDIATFSYLFQPYLHPPIFPRFLTEWPRALLSGHPSCWHSNTGPRCVLTASSPALAAPSWQPSEELRGCITTTVRRC